MCKQQARKNFNLFFLIIFILKSVETFDIAEIVCENFKNYQTDKEVWSSLLKKIQKETYFDYVLIVGEIQHKFLLDIIEVDLFKNVLINRNYLYNYNLDLYSSNFIAIIYMPYGLFENGQSDRVEKYVKVLGDKFNFKRFTRLIVVKQREEKQSILGDNNRNEKEIKMLLELFKTYRFLNVLVLLTDFATSRHYYSYKAYPKFEIVMHVFQNSSQDLLYPPKMNNVYGAILRSIPDQVMPRSVVYKDNLGRVQVTGYVAQFLRMYAKYINSTLKYNDDLKPGNVLFYRDFINWTERDLLDIPCSITPMMAGNTSRLMSYMYEVLSWCLMMPVQQPQTYKDFLEGFLSLTTISLVLMMNSIFTTLLLCSVRLHSFEKQEKFSWHISDIVANPQVILGHLGSSFPLKAKPNLSLRIIYVALFLSGLLYTTAFSVQLNAFLTRPPTQEITSLDDMLKYNKKILAGQDEYKTLLKLSGDTFLPYLSLFHIIESYKDFSEIRGSFNTCFSYPVTSSVWHVYETQQHLFTKPIFRRSSLCFVNMDIMAFILPRNSLHKNKLDTLITRVRDMGFLRYWLENSFYDLVKIGKMSLTDISTSPKNIFHITTADFYYIISTMLKAFGFSLSVFLLEVIWHYRRKILRLCEIK